MLAGLATGKGIGTSSARLVRDAASFHMTSAHPSPRSTRLKALLVARRTSCASACRAVLDCDANAATKRRALAELVRYATPKGVQRPDDLRTAGVASLDGTAQAKGAIHHEHVVPVRLLVDRMVSGDNPADVLAVAVTAHVLRDEHRDIGPLVTIHAELYAEMKVARLADLYEIALRRYTDSRLALERVPDVIDPSNEIEDDIE